MTRPSASLPAVSVVIPTFNRPSLTERAVRSALAQTVAPREIVIVDDASHEPFNWAGGAFSSGAGGATEIRVVRLDANRGAAGARQAGIDATRGDLVAFLDSDDQWAAGKLAAQLEVLAAEQGPQADALTAVVCGWTAVPEDGRPARQRIPVASQSALDFASGCWFSPGTTALVPRAAFDIVGPIDRSLRRLEDLDWFLRLGLAGGRLAVAPVVGATISIGRRGRLKDIDAAGRIILSKVAALPDAALANTLSRRLRAYLDVERANAAYGEARLLATAGYLARSLARKPRLAIPLGAWWRTPDDGEQLQGLNDERS
jgi:glycosyltransferase involved in cell wall biosynthesis